MYLVEYEAVQGHLKCRKARSWVTDSTQSSGWNLDDSEYSHVTHEKQRAECTKSKQVCAHNYANNVLDHAHAFNALDPQLCNRLTTTPPRGYPRLAEHR